MGQMAAGGERHAKDRVAGGQQCQKDGLVRLGAGMRLDIGKGAAEEPLGAVDRQALGQIDELAAAVVATPRIALGILVGQDRALCLQNRARDDVLAGDQLDLELLAFFFSIDCSGDLRISLQQCVTEEIVGDDCVNRGMD